MNWITALSLAGTIQGLFLIVLFSSARKKVALGYIGAVALMVLSLLARVFYDAGFYYLPQVALLSDSLLFVYGPLFCYFFERQFGERLGLVWLTINLAPALLHLATLGIMMNYSTEEYLARLHDGSLNTYFMIVSVTANLHLLVYISWQWWKLKTRGLLEIDGLSLLFIFVYVILLIWAIGNVKAVFNGTVLSNNFFQAIWIGLSMVVYLISFGYFRGVIGLTGKRKKVHQVDLSAFEKLMRDEQKYLDKEIRLPEVAKQLGTNTLFLSQAINQNYNQSFTDYLNEMRIEKFEELAKDQKNANLTHWALAQHAGFNSRSAFYRAYKKARNASPAKVLNAG